MGAGLATDAWPNLALSELAVWPWHVATSASNKPRDSERPIVKSKLLKTE